MEDKSTLISTPSFLVISKVVLVKVAPVTKVLVSPLSELKSTVTSDKPLFLSNSNVPPTKVAPVTTSSVVLAV